MTWAYFRPGGVIDVGARVNPDGIIAEWEFQITIRDPPGMESPYALAKRTEQYHAATHAAAAGLVPRAGGHRQSLCAGILHG